jgi:hypothetical protein
MRALIAARYLMRAPHLREHTDVDVLDVGARDADGNDVFRFARRSAGVTADAAGVIDYFGPLHTILASCLLIEHLPFCKTKTRRAKYITQRRKARKEKRS